LVAAWGCDWGQACLGPCLGAAWGGWAQVCLMALLGGWLGLLGPSGGEGCPGMSLCGFLMGVSRTYAAVCAVPLVAALCYQPSLLLMPCNNITAAVVTPQDRPWGPAQEAHLDIAEARQAGGEAAVAAAAAVGVLLGECTAAGEGTIGRAALVRLVGCCYSLLSLRPWCRRLQLGGLQELMHSATGPPMDLLVPAQRPWVAETLLAVRTLPFWHSNGG